MAPSTIRDGTSGRSPDIKRTGSPDFAWARDRETVAIQCERSTSHRDFTAIHVPSSTFKYFRPRHGGRLPLLESTRQLSTDGTSSRSSSGSRSEGKQRGILSSVFFWLQSTKRGFKLLVFSSKLVSM